MSDLDVDIDEVLFFQRLLESEGVDQRVLLSLSDTDSDEGEDEEDILNAILGGLCPAIMAYASPFYNKERYHTSALSGIAWVEELMEGHPERIRCELGVHLHVFELLLRVLRKIGHKDSKHVPLHEQLAIFLYTCVTGLSTRHVGERFQRSNATIAQYVSRP
jgi:hypothetical protein